MSSNSKGEQKGNLIWGGKVKICHYAGSEYKKNLKEGGAGKLERLTVKQTGSNEKDSFVTFKMAVPFSISA